MALSILNAAKATLVDEMTGIARAVPQVGDGSLSSNTMSSCRETMGVYRPGANVRESSGLGETEDSPRLARSNVVLPRGPFAPAKESLPAGPRLCSG